MGCGKSTIGRVAAKRLGAEFIDMDRAIEQAEGMSVAEIFAARGEAAFRGMEHKLLEGLDPAVNAVVATGGGAPCHHGNMEVMNAKGHTIYLKMSPQRLVGRLGAGREKRPLIKGMDDAQLLAFIESNLKVRAPFYEKAAMTIDCDGVSDNYIAGHIENYTALINYSK